MTKFLKKDQLSSNWYEIDAKDAVVGRLATVISKIIRGKNKTTFTPHMDDGDFVVVKNIEQIKFTGKKFQNKKYYRHTGHPGGIKETTPEKLFEKKPGEALKLAVKRMLPGGVLGKKKALNQPVLSLMLALKIHMPQKYPVIEWLDQMELLEDTLEEVEWGKSLDYLDLKKQTFSLILRIFYVKKPSKINIFWSF